MFDSVFLVNVNDLPPKAQQSVRDFVDFLIFKYDVYLFAGKIYFAANYMQINPVQIFEQPEATATMYLRKVKSNVGLHLVRKGY